MKIPEPIIDPMTIVVQSKRRRPLISSEELVLEGALREEEIAMYQLETHLSFPTYHLP
jgi:hypothetical protein